MASANWQRGRKGPRPRKISPLANKPKRDRQAKAKPSPRVMDSAELDRLKAQLDLYGPAAHPDHDYDDSAQEVTVGE